MSIFNKSLTNKTQPSTPSALFMTSNSTKQKHSNGNKCSTISNDNILFTINISTIQKELSKKNLLKKTINNKVKHNRSNSNNFKAPLVIPSPNILKTNSYANIFMQRKTLSIKLQPTQSSIVPNKRSDSRNELNLMDNNHLNIANDNANHNNLKTINTMHHRNLTVDSEFILTKNNSNHYSELFTWTNMFLQGKNQVEADNEVKHNTIDKYIHTNTIGNQSDKTYNLCKNVLNRDEFKIKEKLQSNQMKVPHPRSTSLNCRNRMVNLPKSYGLKDNPLGQYIIRKKNEKLTELLSKANLCSIDLSKGKCVQWNTLTFKQKMNFLISEQRSSNCPKQRKN